jgi:hypothetical protein
MRVAKDLRDALGLVKDNFDSLGFADRADSIAGLIGAGEYELAYVFLCSNIHEFDMPIPSRAYALLEKLWPDLSADIHRMEGADWHYLDYLGSKPGSPSAANASASLPKLQLKKEKPQDEHPDQPEPREYPWNAGPLGVSEPGNINPNENWKLTEPISIAFTQLVQLGVQIYSVAEGADFTFMVPPRLFPEQYKEVERLIDTIAHEVQSVVRQIDWYPHGYKLRIYIPNPQSPNRAR